LADKSAEFSLIKSAPNFLELSSISRFFAGGALAPPRKAEVSSNSLVNVNTTGFNSAEKKNHQQSEEMYPPEKSWCHNKLC
jgi:hypothetical protein